MNDEDTLLTLQDDYFQLTGREKELAFNKMYSLIKSIGVKMIYKEMLSKRFYIDSDMVDEHSNYIAYRTLRKLFVNKIKRSGFLPIIYTKTYEVLHNTKQRRINEEINNYINVEKNL